MQIQFFLNIYEPHNSAATDYCHPLAHPLLPSVLFGKVGGIFSEQSVTLKTVSGSKLETGEIFSIDASFKKHIIRALNFESPHYCHVYKL